MDFLRSHQFCRDAGNGTHTHRKNGLSEEPPVVPHSYGRIIPVACDVYEIGTHLRKRQGHGKHTMALFFDICHKEHQCRKSYGTAAAVRA